MKKITTVFLILILAAACTSTPKVKNFSNTTLNAGFNTSITMVAYVTDQATFDSYFQMMIDQFTWYNQLFDKYNTYDGINNIKTINDQAGIEAVKVDPELITMLQEAQQYYTVSDGAFDISMGTVLNVWHSYREQAIADNEFNPVGPVPSYAELKAADAYTGMNHIHIDAEASTVYIDNKGTSLDVGGIAKGYATEKVALYLEAQGLSSVAINAGGNVRTIGVKPGNQPWVIGIAKPDGTSAEIDTFNLPGSMAYVTSGDYQRYYIGTDGKRYSHIVDPATLYPATNFRSVTVVTKNSALADPLTKAIIMKSYADGLTFITNYNAAHPEDTISVIWITDDSPEYSDWKLVDGYRINMSDDLKAFSQLYK